jgi:2-polyprenyl-3-methyl-5-hydroxy-6-metoxy-1,4-benzoquinol methylase
MPANKRFPTYLSDQRAFHDAVVTEDLASFDWERRRIRENFDVDQIMRHGRRPERILNIGCGTGSQDVIIADRDHVSVVHAVDPSPKSVEAAERHFPHPKVKRWVAGFKDLPPTRNYDLVMSVDVFEHLDEPDAYFETVSRTARAGGHIVIITPNRLRWSNVVRKALGKPAVLLSQMHYREYSKQDLVAIGAAHNLTLIDSFGSGIHGPLLPSLPLASNLRFGARLPIIAHIIGVVFRTA